MNRFLDRLAVLYAPLGRRGLLMDGQYRFASDAARSPAMQTGAAPVRPASPPSTSSPSIRTTRKSHA